MGAMAPGTVRSAAAVDTWTSFVKGALGALGLALLAVGPFVRVSDAFPYLGIYVYAIGAVLVLTAATMRLRSTLIVLGCLALSAALTFTLIGDTNGERNMAALVLYSAAGLVFGAVARRFWMAIPFLLVPILIVAPHGADWSQSREAFADAWIAALDCNCLLAGLPAAMAVVGGAIGEFRKKGWPDVRPSALPVLILCAGLLMAGLILASLLPDSLAFARMVCFRVALLAVVLGWVALAYQVGRMSFLWEAALACVLALAGALFLDKATQFPNAFGPTLAITVAASLVPAVLAGVGLLVRLWIGTERPRNVEATYTAKERRAVEEKSFFAPPPPMVETGQSGPPVAPPNGNGNGNGAPPTPPPAP
jgi:hypothetical protein